MSAIGRETTGIGRRGRAVAGTAGFLLMNLVVGIVGFTALVTLFAVGVSTAIVWVGLPVFALAVLVSRGGARLERARIYAMLDVWIESPYAPLPASKRWLARVKDPATWRDAAYFLVMLPVGIAQFTLVVTLWSVSLALLGLPIHYRWLPGGTWRGPNWDTPWIVVDSVWEALPFALVGLLAAVVSVAVTRWLGEVHARFARAMLGPVGGPRGE